MERILSIVYSFTIFPVIVVSFFFSFIIDVGSLSLSNQLAHYISHIPTDENDDKPLVLTHNEEISKLEDKTWSSILVTTELFGSIHGKLSLVDFPHVQYIFIQDHSFIHTSEVVISNLTELKTLVVKYYSFPETKSLSLSSSFLHLLLISRFTCPHNIHCRILLFLFYIQYYIWQYDSFSFSHSDLPSFSLFEAENVSFECIDYVIINSIGTGSLLNRCSFSKRFL